MLSASTDGSFMILENQPIPPTHCWIYSRHSSNKKVLLSIYPDWVKRQGEFGVRSEIDASITRNEKTISTDRNRQTEVIAIMK